MATPVRMPLLGMTMEEGIVSKWLVAEGETVKAGQPLLEFETDKINAQVEAPVDGVVGGIQAREGQAVKVQGVLAYILALGEQPPAAGAAPVSAAGAKIQPPAAAHQGAAVVKPVPVPAAGQHVQVQAEAAPIAPLSRTDGRIKASPLARRLARETGAEMGLIAGSGPGGRIVADDVRAFASRPQIAAPAARAVPVAAPAAAVTVPLKGIRRAIADRMMHSLSSMAQLTLVTEADATEFVELRSNLAAQHEAALGYKISYNDLLARMVTRALVEHPNVNATLQGENIVRLPYVNIGLAVELTDGLVVTNVKNAQDMQLAGLSKALRDLAERAKGGKLTLDEITGGTFTITNLGALDVDAFTPVINPPECAILGVGRIAAKPAVVDGQLAVRQLMTLSLTFDHRVNDGAPAARFLQRIKQFVEQPYLLI